MQRLFGAGFRALAAENALCSVFTFAGFFIDLRIHEADLQALAAVNNTLILIAVDAQERETAHRLEEHRDGAQILAERTVLSLKANANAMPAA